MAPINRCRNEPDDHYPRYRGEPSRAGQITGFDAGRVQASNLGSVVGINEFFTFAMEAASSRSLWVGSARVTIHRTHIPDRRGRSYPARCRYCRRPCRPSRPCSRRGKHEWNAASRASPGIATVGYRRGQSRKSGCCVCLADSPRSPSSRRWLARGGRAGVRGGVPCLQSVSVRVGAIHLARTLSSSSYVDSAAMSVTV
jgi:hypothetical protein